MNDGAIHCHDAKANLSKLIALALDGGEVGITRRSVSAVRLVAIAARGERRFGALKGKIAADASLEDPLPEDELGLFNA